MWQKKILNSNNKSIKFEYVEIFIFLFVILLPLISLPISEITKIGTLIYLMMSFFTLYVIRDCKNIFDLQKINLYLSKLSNKDLDKIIFIISIICLFGLIAIRINAIGIYGSKVFSPFLIIQLRESWLDGKIELNTFMRLVSVFTYIGSFWSLLISIRKQISNENLSFFYSLPWIILAFINGSRNMLLYCIFLLTLIKLKKLGGSIKIFLFSFKLKKKLIISLISLTIISSLMLLLNFSRTFHHESSLIMYEEFRGETCNQSYKNLQGESKISCPEKGYTGFIPLGLNPYYISHGILNLNILLENSEISLFKKNLIDNFFYSYSARLLPKNFWNKNEYRGHAAGGSTLFGEIMKKYGMVFLFLYPISIKIFDKLLKLKIPVFFKLLLTNSILVNIIFMPFFEGNTNLVGLTTNISLLLIPILNLIFSTLVRLKIN